MMLLTSDNLYYQDHAGAAELEFNPSRQQPPQHTLQGLPEEVRVFLAQSIAPNSRRAYATDLGRFRKWGGCLPADAVIVATYLAQHAETHSVSTLRRWAASLSRAHSAAGHPDPTKSEPAKSTLRGICRGRGEALRCAAPLLRDDLFTALDAMGNSIRDKRDRSLLLMGFAAGFRRSELVGLNLEDVAFVRRGVVVTLRRSKTDQGGIGREIAIPFGKTRHCPIAALEEWLGAAAIFGGPVYRPIRRHGPVSDQRLSGEAVSTIVKQRVVACGFDPNLFSGHSLRAGFATSAAQAGVSSWKIRQQTGHASDAMLARYIRSAELFEGNATAAVL